MNLVLASDSRMRPLRMNCEMTTSMVLSADVTLRAALTCLDDKVVFDETETEKNAF